MKSALLAVLALGCTMARPPRDHTVERALRVDGLNRSYLLHIPPTLDATRPVPVILVFHGGGGSARQMERFCGLNAIADTAGFLVAYPDGVEKNWNDGRAVEASRAHREQIDDVGFVDAVLEDIARRHPVDPKRVYATGISNGAFMSHWLGAERSSRFAAIAPVVGGMAPTIAADFGPAEPVSVLVLQGTEDPLVPYAGGAIKYGRGQTVSTDSTLKKWVRHDGCGEPMIEDLPDRDPEDGTTIRRTTWSGGRDGAEVVLYRIEGGGHTWPGGSQYLPQGLIGRVSREIDANAVIWDFFLRHPKK